MLILKLLRFVVLLPIRVLAFLASFIFGILSKMVSIVTNMASLILAVYNIMVMLIFFGMLINKEYGLLINCAYMVAGEAIILTIVGFTNGVLDVCAERLMKFAICGQF